MKSFVCNSFARKLICVLLLIATVLCLPACTGSSGETVSIVCTAYPQYDFVMQILGEQADRFSVVYLADDGSDMHSFQNRITAADKLTLLRADLLLYTGGTSDAWLSDLLDDPSANPEMVRLSMLSACELLEENEHEHDGETDGQEEDHAYDEHVWLSLRNAQRMTRAILEELIRLDPGQEELYRAHAEDYCARLQQMDERFMQVVADAPRDTVVLADRYPFRYLMHDYGLTCCAAFPGCSSETDASFATVLELAQTADRQQLSVILVLEHSTAQVADAVIQATQAKNQRILTLHSLQSVTSSDIENGLSYLSVMERNLQVLEEVLYS